MGKFMKRKGEQGVTLIELMIVVAIMGIVVGAMYSMFNFQRQSYTVQDNVAVMQQNVRIGLEYVVKEVRMAGYIPEDIAAAPNWGMEPNAEPPVPAPHNNGIVESIEEATADSIFFQADIDDDEWTDAVRYSLDYDAGKNSTNLMREVWNWDGSSWNAADLDGDTVADGPQIIADNIDNLVFTYSVLAVGGVNGVGYGDGEDDDGPDMDGDGIDDGDGTTDEAGELLRWNFGVHGDLDSDTERRCIRKVHVTMTARSPAQDGSYFHPDTGDHFRRKTLTSNISVRNMQ